jgi:hypothetical protein
MMFKFLAAASLLCISLIATPGNSQSLSNSEDNETAEMSVDSEGTELNNLESNGIQPLAMGREDRCCILKNRVDGTVGCLTLHNMRKVRANSICRSHLSNHISATDFVVRGGTCESSWYNRCFLR